MITRIRLFFKCLFILMREGGAWEIQERDWGKQDVATLKGFLAGDTGQNLISRLRAMSLLHNKRAVLSGRQWRCGYGAGYMAALTDLDMLADFTGGDSPDEPQQQDADEGESVDFSKLTPFNE